MYIDSPVFVKRKVMMIAKDAQKAEQYRFGSQRQKLAQHVHQQLNEHDQDIIILERFRKEAEELKRQKFLAKRNRSQPPPEDLQQYQQPKMNSNKNSMIREFHENPELKPTFSTIIQTPKADLIQLKTIEHSTKNDNDQGIIYHYEKLLRSKDKELKKKQRKIDKSKVTIKKMNSKIHQIERQRRFILKEQEMQSIKINALIEEMNYKIAVNKATFREELAKLKFDMINQVQILPAKSIVKRSALSIPNLPRPKQLQLLHNSQRFHQGPSLYYEMPTHSSIDLRNNHMTKSNLQTAGKSLQRMKNSQKFLENQFQKYQN